MVGVGKFLRYETGGIGDVLFGCGGGGFGAGEYEEFAGGDVGPGGFGKLEVFGKNFNLNDNKRLVL